MPGPPSVRGSPRSRAGSHHTPGAHGAGLAALALGALGVVYGDIGTSPLYAVKECVHGPHSVPPVEANVLGILSLMFWSVTLVVSIKYVNFILRANNQGEGGVLAMLALLPEGKPRKVVGTVGLLTSLVLIGSCLLYGEGIITPAISVLSAVEGLSVATTAFDKLIVPITVVILLVLFSVQKRGTGLIGRVFGPIMVTWFTTLAALGVWSILKEPAVLRALSPHYAAEFFVHNGLHGFTVLGSVVLCITGSEALYADMGHFGPRPIRLAWYFLAMPALILNYLGQGAILLAHPERAESIAVNPFFALVPQGPAVYALVALATAATVIASQALISGAYSLTRQAVQLGFLPRVRILHTSSEAEGQIYIPEVNAALAVGCITLVLVFQSSSKLAAAYGIAVMGTMAITSTAFYFVCIRRWHWPLYKALPLLLLFLTVELTFLASNMVKFFDGGFVPLVIAAALFLVMRVWKRGRGLLAQHFARASTPLDAFLEQIGRGVYRLGQGKEHGVLRTEGTAVFLTSNPTGTPPLLMHHTHHNRAIRERVLLVTVVNEKVPRVLERAVEVEPLLHGFFRVHIRVGFMETPDVPAALEEASKLFDVPIDLEDVTYYLGRETLLASAHGDMGRQAERLFAFLSRNSNQAPSYFGIPPQCVVEIGMQVDL